MRLLPSICLVRVAAVMWAPSGSHRRCLPRLRNASSLQHLPHANIRTPSTRLACTTKKSHTRSKSERICLSTVIREQERARLGVVPRCVVAGMKIARADRVGLHKLRRELPAVPRRRPALNSNCDSTRSLNSACVPASRNEASAVCAAKRCPCRACAGMSCAGSSCARHVRGNVMCAACQGRNMGFCWSASAAINPPTIARASCSAIQR